MLRRFKLCRLGLGRTAQLPKIEMLPLSQRSGLEALGTAFLAFTISRVGTADLNGFEQSMSIGLCLALLIHVIGRFSGAHFNPAVTVLLTQQRFGQKAFRSVESWLEAGSYIVAQIIGALIGFALTPVPETAGEFTVAGLIPEAVFSLALYALILRWSDEGRICPFAQPLSGIVIGAGLGFLAVVGGLTQSGIYNPAIVVGLSTHGMSGIVLAIVGQLIAMTILLLVTTRQVASAD